MIISLFSIKKISQAQANELMKTLSDNIYNTIESELTETINVSRVIANDSFLIELLKSENSMDSDAVSETLASYASRLRNTFAYSWVSIVSDQSKAYYTNEGFYRTIDPENNPDDEWYSLFMEQDKEYTVSIGRDNDMPDVLTVFVDIRIEDEDGDFLGICGIALEMHGFEELLLDYEEQYEIEVLFTDEDGVPQLGSGNGSSEAQTYTLPSEAYHNPLTYRPDHVGIDYTVIKYIEPLNWYMIILNFNPYNYTMDYLLIFFTVVSLIIFLVILVMSLYFIIKREKWLFNSSFNDALTGLYNRRAYNDHVDRLRDLPALKDIVIIAFDVNGLKQVNDTLGHTAGDELITGAADTILDTFMSYGKCYRTGGDEFIAILDKPVKNMESLTGKFEHAAAAWHGKNVKELSISYGIVRAADYEDASIDELLAIADEKMYDRKKEYHRSTDTSPQNPPAS
jgi:diguanylate cyclase (GGDEF)-like protein